MALWKSNDRDTRQRTIGTIAFSTLAHAGLLIGLLVSASPLLRSSGGGDAKPLASAEPSSLSMVTLSDASVASAPPTSGEVLVAKESDPTGVEVPKETIAPKPVAVVKAPAPRPVVKVAKTKPSKPAKTSGAKAEAKTKIAAEENGDEAFQPAAVADMSNEDERAKMPESLSPEISDGPEEQPQQAVAEETKTDTAPPEPAKEEPVKEEAPIVAAAPVVEPVQPEAKPEPKLEPVAPAPAETKPAAPSAPAVAAAQPSSAQPAQGSSSASTQPATAAAVAAPTAASAGNGGSGGGGSLASALGSNQPIVDASLRRPTYAPKPSYPQMDRLKRHQGTAVVIGKVRTDGSVEAVAIESRSGSDQMDRSAAEAFKSWKFAPGRETLVRQPFQFSLSGEAQEMRAKLRR